MTDIASARLSRDLLRPLPSAGAQGSEVTLDPQPSGSRSQDAADLGVLGTDSGAHHGCVPFQLFSACLPKNTMSVDVEDDVLLGYVVMVG